MKNLKIVGAVIAFIVLYLFAPIVVNLALRIFDFFSPTSMQHGARWLQLVTYLIVPFAIKYCIDYITAHETATTLVLMIIGAAYTIFVATWNYAGGTTALSAAVSMYCEAAAFVVCAVSAGKEYLQNRKSEDI